MHMVMFFVFRAAHVLAAALWIGSTVFISALLVPAIEVAGPAAGGAVMQMIDRRGINLYMGLLGGMTVLSGVYLLWRFTGGFDPAVLATHAGLAFAVGGVSGVLASAIGGGVVGRSAKQIGPLMAQAVAAPDEAARNATIERASMLRRRVKAGSRLTIALQAIALVLMALGHYV